MLAKKSSETNLKWEDFAIAVKSSTQKHQPQSKTSL